MSEAEDYPGLPPLSDYYSEELAMTLRAFEEGRTMDEQHVIEADALEAAEDRGVYREAARYVVTNVFAIAIVGYGLVKALNVIKESK